MPGKRVNSFVPRHATMPGNVSDGRFGSPISDKVVTQSETHVNKLLLGTTGMNEVKRVHRDKGIGVNVNRNIDIVGNGPHQSASNATQLRSS